ncbi:MAG: methionine--tRNA ligase [Myxococcota bacterium]
MPTLITSGLPYINGIKHLGNLVGSMLPADVYARFLRQRGEEVLYFCGTDEHGAPAELAAEAAGEPVAQYCERMYSVQADIYQKFGISFDHFGRTSSPQNCELTQKIFLQLDANGYIKRRVLKQYYSPAEQRYLADRYIMGTCPHCGYERARGDQCENCTRLLDPVDLIEPRSALSGSADLELRESEHLFLDLPALQSVTAKWVEKQDSWPALSKQIAVKWLKEGLQERGITRNLKWGIDVPLEGFEDLVFYVWFDAPIGYIGITREYFDAKDQSEEWKRWWLGAEDVRYVQFMGKDNLPFHTLMFPAMLLGASPDWKLATQIAGFHWLDYYGGKFSTSLGRGIFTDAAIELYPADYWRYYLMANLPETGDSTFTWPLFGSAVNKDLAGILGNFVNRVLQFAQRKLGSTVPAGGQPGPQEEALIASCRELTQTFEEAMNKVQIRSAMRALRQLWVTGNRYIDDRAPWKLLKTDKDEAAMVIRTAFNLIALFASISHPIIPDSSKRMLQALGIDDLPQPQTLVGLDAVAAGASYELIPPLFSLISDDDIAAYEERFGT